MAPISVGLWDYQLRLSHIRETESNANVSTLLNVLYVYCLD
jgi:hypothetical protein